MGQYWEKLVTDERTDERTNWHFQKMMTSSCNNYVINHAEIFTRYANSYLVQTGKISSWLDKYFKNYRDPTCIFEKTCMKKC